MAGIEDGRQANTLNERLNNVVMDLVVSEATGLLMVDRVNALIVSIIFIAVLVLNLTTMSYVL